MDNLKLKDFLDYNFLSGAAISPDKENAAFVVKKADYDNNSYLSNIWIYNFATSKYSKLTSLNSEESFVWLNDSTVLFPALRDEKLKAKIDDGEKWTVYYAIDIHGGEAQEYMRIPLSITDIRVADNEKFLITATNDLNAVNLNMLLDEAKSTAIKEMKENKDYEIIDEIPFWGNGRGFTNKKRNRLYLYDKKNNNLIHISKDFENVEMSHIKDNKVLYTTQSYTDKKDTKNGLSMYDISANTVSVLIEEGLYSIEFAELIEDKIIFCGSLGDKYGLNQNGNLYVIENGEIKFLCEHDFGCGNSTGSDCRLGGGTSAKVSGDKLYFISTEAKSSFIKKLSLDGSIEKLTADIGSVDCFDVCDDKILFIGLRGLRLQELYSLADGIETQITKLNENIINSKKLSYPENLNFSNDNINIDGFVLKPIDYDETKTYPAILDIHGGPKTTFGEVFFHEMQYWANEGYFVFFCNPRGSDGRGNEFADIRGKYGTIDFDDLMKFTDLVLAKYPQIDSKRVGVTGGSYGGFMTNWIIGHTDRFKCAASQRSISNWISKFGTTDIGYYFNADQNQSTPWDNMDKLWWHSPLKYADKCVTPTLFIHSEEDYRCWLPEGLQMFTALKYHGVDARLCMFRGENHELSRSGKPKHRIKRLTEMTNWFNKYLK